MRGTLDAPNRKLLQKREEFNPGLTYPDFWAELEHEFEVDLKPRHRAAWQQVKLDENEQLDLRAWKHFSNEFEIHRNRVSNWTLEEEYGLLMKQLPYEWRLKIARRKIEGKNPILGSSAGRSR